MANTEIKKGAAPQKGEQEEKTTPLEKKRFVSSENLQLRPDTAETNFSEEEENSLEKATGNLEKHV